MQLKSLSWALCTGLLAVAFGCSGHPDSTPSGTSSSTGGTGSTQASAKSTPSSTVSPSSAPSTATSSQASSVPSTPVTAATEPATPAAAAVQQFAHEWYVAPSGNDTAEGSQSRPFRTIGKALSVVQAGERINVLSGDYPEHLGIQDGVAAGTADKPIVLQGHGSPRLLVGDDHWAQVDVKKPYWTIDGFELDAGGLNHAGVSFTGTTEGSVLSHSEVHHGTAGGAVVIATGATGVTVDSNHLHDYGVDGTDAHGVLVEWTTKNSTITNNRIHDVSGDSVQCEGPEPYDASLPPADTVRIEGNEMFHNGEQAVDIKTCHNVTIRKNNIHDFTTSSLPGGCSMVIHMSARDVLVEDNDFLNTGKALALGGNHVGPVPTNITIQKNRFVGMHTGNTLDGTAVRIENSNNTKVLNNTFTQSDGPAMILAMGDQGATTNLTVENNLVDAATAVKLGSFGQGLAFKRNLYRSAASFQVPTTGAVGLAAWQQGGRDADAVVGDAQLSADGTLTPGAAAADQGLDVGLPFCGAAPELGAVELCQ